jgi:hypothetical protein
LAVLPPSTLSQLVVLSVDERELVRIEIALPETAGRLPFWRLAMNWSTLMKQRSAFLPVAMSLAALATVVVYLAMFGVVREPDEGTAAHMIVAFFAIKWLPQNPRQALVILALQVCAALAALAPVYFSWPLGQEVTRTRNATARLLRPLPCWS